MPVLPPPLTAEHVAYVEDAASYLVGSCNAERVPELVRAAGVRVWPGGARITILVPMATAARTLENIAANPRVAVTTAQLPTFGTLQLKGTVTGTRPATDDDRPVAIKAQARFAKEFAWTGPAVTEQRRIQVWPCMAIDVEVSGIYPAAPNPKGAAP